MLRWKGASCLPSVFHVFGGLSRKVCTDLKICPVLTHLHRVLLATIRDKGQCPCPRCLVPKSHFDLMGMIRDATERIKSLRSYLLDTVKKARSLIYEKGFGIKSAAVEALLKPTSSVPTIVRLFNNRLSSLGHHDVECIHVPPWQDIPSTAHACSRLLA